MNDVLTCPKCNEPFRVSFIGGPFPGGKERENIDCPSCGCTVDTEVTSSVIRTRVLTPEEKAKLPQA